VPVESQQLEVIINRKPFQPFMLYLKDGRQFKVLNPRTTLVCARDLILGIASPEEEKQIVPICEYKEFIWLDHIDRAEMLDEPAPFPQTRGGNLEKPDNAP
jgi:hypothetical protein